MSHSEACSWAPTGGWGDRYRPVGTAAVSLCTFKPSAFFQKKGLFLPLWNAMLPLRRLRTWGLPGTSASLTPRATALTAPYLCGPLRRPPAPSSAVLPSAWPPRLPSHTHLGRSHPDSAFPCLAVAQCAYAELHLGDCPSRSCPLFSKDCTAHARPPALPWPA